ncbi:MAG: sigma-70 family RNA polymerase sigma factor [Acidobacteriota bacterium]|nr:sigma-70 family RNA polymerase sigma factor [Acidobacteriota bacterium]
MGTTPAQSVESNTVAGIPSLGIAIDGAFFEELWRESDAANYGLDQSEFSQILLRAGTAQNFGLDLGTSASRQQQEGFFRGLKLADLVLARACAAGNERAWERFLELYRQPLVRAATAITGSELLGADLADQLYAELYGLTTRDGERRCPLESYRGRGSLIGWLRTTLAQRHVDHHRHSHREQPLEEYDAPAPEPEPQRMLGELTALAKAIESALHGSDPEERFLLAAYYLDGQTLFQMGRVLHVHEATVSRKLRRATDEIRKRVLKNLQALGLSRRAAQEALGADPRDLDVNLKILLQNSQSDTFQEKAAT